MTYTDLANIDPALVEALGLWQTLRKLGYPADNIYVGVYVHDKAVDVEVRATIAPTAPYCGPYVRKLRMACGDRSVDADTFMAQYKAASALLPTLAQDELDAFWKRSKAASSSAGIILALSAAGISRGTQ